MRRAAAIAFAALVVIAALALLREGAPPQGPSERAAPARPLPTAPAIPPEHMPPPFADRNVRLPEPGAAPPPETSAFCASQNWSRLSESALRPTPGANGTLAVDAEAWERTLSNTRAGLASWMSQCQQAGGRISIVANTTGERLATYDPHEGLRAAR